MNMVTEGDPEGAEIVRPRQAPMGIASAFVGCAGRAVSEHCVRLPSGQAHQVAFGAAIGQPVMRKRMP